MGIRKAHLDMIKSMNGGIECMAAGLGMSACALTNRVYEKKGQSVSVADSLAMQVLSGTTRFAEEIALASGGVFTKLPDFDDCNEEMLCQFLRLSMEVGELSRAYQDALANDGQIDRQEKADITAIKNSLLSTVQKLTSLMFKVHCAPGV